MSRVRLCSAAAAVVIVSIPLVLSAQRPPQSFNSLRGIAARRIAPVILPGLRLSPADLPARSPVRGVGQGDLCAGLSGAAHGLCSAAVAAGCADGTGNPESCQSLARRYTATTGEPGPWLVSVLASIDGFGVFGPSMSLTLDEVTLHRDGSVTGTLVFYGGIHSPETETAAVLELVPPADGRPWCVRSVETGGQHLFFRISDSADPDVPDSILWGGGDEDFTDCHRDPLPYSLNLQPLASGDFTTFLAP